MAISISLRYSSDIWHRVSLQLLEWQKPSSLPIFLQFCLLVVLWHLMRASPGIAIFMTIVSFPLMYHNIWSPILNLGLTLDCKFSHYLMLIVLGDSSGSLRTIFVFCSYSLQWTNLATLSCLLLRCFWSSLLHALTIWDCFVSAATHPRKGRFASLIYWELGLISSLLQFT